MDYYLAEIKNYECEEKQNILIAACDYKDALDKIISHYINDIEIENIKISFLCECFQELSKEMVASLKKFAKLNKDFY